MKINTNPFHYSVATRVRVPYLWRYLDLQPGDRLLDVGCGVGYFSHLVQAKGFNVYGVDVDVDAVATARRMTGGRFVAATIDKLPFRDSTFDKILCSEVLEHVTDDIEAVKELRRVAKSGATVMITVPCTQGVFGSRIKSICHGDDIANGGGSWEQHQREGYAREELRTLLQQAGIEVLRERYTMVFFTELLMGATKVAYSLASHKKHLHSQHQVLEVRNSPMLKVFRMVFPVLLPFTRLEDLALSPILRGHMLVVKGVVHK